MEGERYGRVSIQKELRGKLWNPKDAQFPVVQRVLSTNYASMDLPSFKTEFDALWATFETSNRSFTFLFAAAVAYSQCTAENKASVLTGLKFQGCERDIVERCGPLFVQYPRLAYLKTTFATQPKHVDWLVRFFSDGRCDGYFPLWTRADNTDPPPIEENVGDLEIRVRNLRM